MKFRKKPVVIEAMLWEGHNSLEVMLWVKEKCYSRSTTQMHFSGSQVVIPTLEGSMCADPGDYIICGVKGEFYPCKPDIFFQTYEPA